MPRPARVRRLMVFSLLAGALIGGPAAHSVGCGLELDPAWSFKDADLLFSVAAPEGGAPVIVGSEYFGGKGAPLALNWNGAAWTKAQVPVVTEGALVTFHDSAALPDGQVLAAGTLRTNRTEIVRWTGSEWLRMNSPEVGEENSQLLGIDARAMNDAWAVGKYTLEGRSRALTQRWNGASWKVVDVAAPKSTDSTVLKDVVALGPDDAVAVGWSIADGGQHRALILRWDGSGWNEVVAPTYEGDAMLMGVDAFGPGDVWAVGWTADLQGDTAPLVLHWDGRSWQQANLPEFEGRGRLQGLTVTAEGGILAVGDVKDEQGRYAPLAFTWDWSGWGPVPLPAIDTYDAFLASAAAPAPGQVIVVGTHRGPDGFGSLLLRGCVAAPPA